MNNCACFSLPKITHTDQLRKHSALISPAKTTGSRSVPDRIRKSQKKKKKDSQRQISLRRIPPVAFTLSASSPFLKPPSWFHLLSTPFVDNWNNPTDAQLCRALQPIRGWQPSTAGTANYTSASDQRSRPDHRHSDRQSDPACHQHPGNHTVANQAWTAGNDVRRCANAHTCKGRHVVEQLIIYLNRAELKAVEWAAPSGAAFVHERNSQHRQSGLFTASTSSSSCFSVHNAHLHHSTCTIVAFGTIAPSVCVCKCACVCLLMFGMHLSANLSNLVSGSLLRPCRAPSLQKTQNKTTLFITPLKTQTLLPLFSTSFRFTLGLQSLSAALWFVLSDLN